MTALRGGIYTVVTMDEGLYNKAKMLQWEKTEHLKNVVLVLGGFHTQMTFSKVIGQFLESSGISDIWVESEIFGETTAGNILRGKLWNRVIRAHKLTYEALWRVLRPIIVAWARDGGHDDEGELAALPAKLAAGFSLDEKGLTAIDSPVYRHAVNEMGHVLTSLLSLMRRTNITQRFVTGGSTCSLFLSCLGLQGRSGKETGFYTFLL